MLIAVFTSSMGGLPQGVSWAVSVQRGTVGIDALCVASKPACTAAKFGIDTEGTLSGMGMDMLNEEIGLDIQQFTDPSGAVKKLALEEAAKNNPDLQSAMDTYQQLEGLQIQEAEIEVSSKGVSKITEMEISQETQIGNFIGIKTEEGETIKKDELTTKNVKIKKEEGITTLIIQQDGYIDIKGDKFADIKEGGTLKLNEQGELVSADFTSEGGTYNIGGKSIQVPAETKIVFEEGKLTIESPEEFKIDEKYSINSKGKVHVEGNQISGKEIEINGLSFESYFKDLEEANLEFTEQGILLKQGRMNTKGLPQLKVFHQPVLISEGKEYKEGYDNQFIIESDNKVHVKGIIFLGEDYYSSDSISTESDIYIQEGIIDVKRFEEGSRIQSKMNGKTHTLTYKKEEKYTIKKGDTLSQIAFKHSMSVEELARINNIKDINKIYAGKELKIREIELKVSTIEGKTIEETNSEEDGLIYYPTSLVTDKLQASQTSEGMVYGQTSEYEIRKGDTLWAIAKKDLKEDLGRDPTTLEITQRVEHIQKINPQLDSKNMQIGQTITLLGDKNKKPVKVKNTFDILDISSTHQVKMINNKYGSLFTKVSSDIGTKTIRKLGGTVDKESNIVLGKEKVRIDKILGGLIQTESGVSMLEGKKKVVSPTGVEGYLQITGGTAEDVNQHMSFTRDDYYNPPKEIQAATIVLLQKQKYLANYIGRKPSQIPTKAILASYNAGHIPIGLAIKDLESQGIKNPTWDQISSTIKPKHVKKIRYFSKMEDNDPEILKKIKEIRDYPGKVMKHM